MIDKILARSHNRSSQDLSRIYIYNYYIIKSQSCCVHRTEIDWGDLKGDSGSCDPLSIHAKVVPNYGIAIQADASQ